MIGCYRAARWSFTMVEQGRRPLGYMRVFQILLCRSLQTNRFGPKPILVDKLSVENLTQAIVEADSSIIRKRAQFFGQGIRNEDGINNAIMLIESHVFEFEKNLDSVF